MFIPLIIGVSDRDRVLREGVRRTCPFCARETAHRDVQVHRHLALFFIPVWRWGRRRVLRCQVCGTERPITAEGSDVAGAPPGPPP